MLGKTNINTLTEGTIVTEIENYRWIQMKSGIFSDFVKAIYKNDYLAAITADGKVVYTTDGEVWTVSVLEYEDCRLHDIDFDGSQFILVGSYLLEEYSDPDFSREGLILVTSDFNFYEKKNIMFNSGVAVDYLAVYPQNGKYIVVADKGSRITGEGHICVGNLETQWETDEKIQEVTKCETFSIAKNASGIIITGLNYEGSNYYNSACQIINGVEVDVEIRYEIKQTDRYYVKNINAFECKDELYYIFLRECEEYEFAKVVNSNSGDVIVISNHINYMFKDGVYFNGCQLFINAHEMLIVKKGENITDKKLDDLIEIAPELTMNCITKAFGQLFIFGNQGVILKSSVEVNNEEAVVVQTLSAKKALAEAKTYADERYAALEARIVALEEFKEA
ncbi:MAG: hypothetical protein HFI51_07915 [Lachnospiraceae bacterium]|jgi:hypothetical protein|nr:hypothetical protein [Lachnospiraceae bacterium]